MSAQPFRNRFEELTGKPPLAWQVRLYSTFEGSPEKWPPIIDIPTGMGKTMLMAIWLIARENRIPMPTRLVYARASAFTACLSSILSILLVPPLWEPVQTGLGTKDTWGSQEDII